MKKLFLLTVMTCLFAFAASSALAGPQDFTLVNASSSSICYVYVAPTSSNDWESDVLGANECLEPGERVLITFNSGNQAMWDLRVEDENGNYESYDNFNLNTISTITIKGGGQVSYQ